MCSRAVRWARMVTGEPSGGHAGARGGDGRRIRVLASIAALLVLGLAVAYKWPSTSGGRPGQIAPMRGIRLQDITWQEAERALTPDAVVVIPLGAAAKEHGPHLRLQNDLLLAEYFERRV